MEGSKKIQSLDSKILVSQEDLDAFQPGDRQYFLVARMVETNGQNQLNAYYLQVKDMVCKME